MMDMFFSKVFTKKLNNIEVENAIEKLNTYASSENRINFYHSVRNAKLVLAVLSNIKDTTVLKEDADIKLLTSNSPEDGIVLLVFTSIEKLKMRKPEANYIILKFDEIVEIILRHNYDGLIINPSGAWAGIPKGDIIKYFQN
jgi:hypothetical protein